ncbi:hypothetical protein [Streptacidiphilus sp. EB129]|uniref:hypothetical protein n=1 Tax=Streptacidiphilus sp. EB129 TaxID=3156262 RepID=UPI0035125F41
MIPAGVTPADSAFAAKLQGISVATFRRHKAWEQLPPVLSRKDAKVRIWSQEQLLAAHAGEPIPPLPRQLTVEEMSEEQRAAVEAGEAVPTAPDPDDLLDYEEARLALPAERRPAPVTWRGYILYGTGPTPRPQDEHFGVPHWRRGALAEWNAQRRGRGGGPGRQGAPDKNGRVLKAERWTIAEQRRERAAQMLAEQPELRAETLAQELGVTQRHAERLLAQARAELNAR